MGIKILPRVFVGIKYANLYESVQLKAEFLKLKHSTNAFLLLLPLPSFKVNNPTFFYKE